VFDGKGGEKKIGSAHEGKAGSLKTSHEGRRGLKSTFSGEFKFGERSVGRAFTADLAPFNAFYNQREERLKTNAPRLLEGHWPFLTDAAPIE